MLDHTLPRDGQSTSDVQQSDARETYRRWDGWQKELFGEFPFPWEAHDNYWAALRAWIGPWDQIQTDLLCGTTMGILQVADSLAFALMAKVGLCKVSYSNSGSGHQWSPCFFFVGTHHFSPWRKAWNDNRCYWCYSCHPNFTNASKLTFRAKKTHKYRRK